MKKIKSVIQITTIALIVSVFLTSCMITKTSVGQFRETPGREYTYAKGKQIWLFWGLLPLGRTNVNTPGDGNCEVITRFKLGDVLVSCLTVGVVTSYTIEVKAKKKQ